MKKLSLLCLVILVPQVIGIAAAPAVPLELTYTADNVVSRLWWSVDGNTPVSLVPGPNASQWPLPDTFSVDLSLGHSYQFIWQAVNLDPTGRPPSSGNPGAFLGQISQVPLVSANFLSSSLWEIAVRWNNLGPPADFSSLNWTAATEWGANNDPSVIWYQVNGGPVPGISVDARWIWTVANFEMQGAPGPNDSVFIRTTVDVPAHAPEPATLFLLSSGLLGLAGLKRARQRVAGSKTTCPEGQALGDGEPPCAGSRNGELL